MCLIYGYPVQAACLHSERQRGSRLFLVLSMASQRLGAIDCVSTHLARQHTDCELTLYSFSSFPMKRLAPTMRSGVAAQQLDMLAFQPMMVAFQNYA